MTRVAMVRRDERNSKFCNVVEKGEHESCKAAGGEPYQSETVSLESTVGVRLNYSSDLEDSLIYEKLSQNIRHA